MKGLNVMSKMIQTASGFQYSVNIEYDLHNTEKLGNFIPTRSSLSLLEDILESTQNNATNRARILIGAYGKGKSHIVLTILSLLMKKNRDLFVHLNEKLQENNRLSALLKNYYSGKVKLLPVVISGNSTSLHQAFIFSLQKTLSENDLMNVMPETNYAAAIKTIQKWEKNYPQTFKAFAKEINGTTKDFIKKLQDFDVNAYRQFEQVYPELTAGSIFNPFVGFDVVDLYESVAKALKRTSKWTGLYVVYDEFSKYLEANISTASVSDTKMLQDFAEKCSRSGDTQMHLMLISHKEIANYIDQLPKQKTDGWRGISERFEHVLLNNNFTQVYEIISSVIKKKPADWNRFKKSQNKKFDDLFALYSKHPLFNEMKPDEVQKLLLDCYPLHPVSVFILPRLSEQIAQNERTLFTFLSAQGHSTLSAFLSGYDDSNFKLVTPDLLFDYFEQLFKKEIYNNEIRDVYLLASRALDKIGKKKVIECKIIKTLCLLYILQQFEKIKPVKEEIFRIYKNEYTEEDILLAIDNLVEKEFVVYLRQSNSYLKLKESSGVDIEKTINDEIERQRNRFDLCDILNEFNTSAYLYPSRYNDENEMTRWFDFIFVSDKEFIEDTDWQSKYVESDSDGQVIAVVLSGKFSAKKIRSLVEQVSAAQKQILFVVPTQFNEIESIAKKYSAVYALREKSHGDSALEDEYQVVIDDLSEVLYGFIADYIRAERNASSYIYCGEDACIGRKSELSEKLSEICESIYSKAPIIKNEAINKNTPTTVMENARDKVVSALLRNELEYNLGLTGTGPDVFIMRSVLINTGLLINEKNDVRLNFDFQKKDDVAVVKPIIDALQWFVNNAAEKNKVSFGALYRKLTSPGGRIGMRKGVIPIFIAAFLHCHKKSISIHNENGSVEISVQTLNQINKNPDSYTLTYISWDATKEKYIHDVKTLFGWWLTPYEMKSLEIDGLASAMNRWYFDLPKYTKEIYSKANPKKINQTLVDFLNLFTQNVSSEELLLVRIPTVFSGKPSCGKNVFIKLSDAKKDIEETITRLKQSLFDTTRIVFANQQVKKASVPSICKEWTKRLDKNASDNVFDDGITDRMLNLFYQNVADETRFIEGLAEILTGLRIADWNYNTIDSFKVKLKECKNTVENYKDSDKRNRDNSYRLSFTDEKGRESTKTFNKVDLSPRSRLLFNKMEDALNTMGQAMTAAEKRQVVVDILQKMCGENN